MMKKSLVTLVIVGVASMSVNSLSFACDKAKSGTRAAASSEASEMTIAESHEGHEHDKKDHADCKGCEDKNCPMKSKGKKKGAKKAAPEKT